MTTPGPSSHPTPPTPGSTVVGVDGVTVGRVAAVAFPPTEPPMWVAVTLAGTADLVLAPLTGAHRTMTGITVAADAATVFEAPRVAGPAPAPTDVDYAGAYYLRHTTDSWVASVVRSREDLAVRTEWVPYRRVRLRKRVVTEERTITVTVRREELVIDDSDIDPDDAITDAERPHHGSGRILVPENGVIEMTLHAEEPVVTTRVVAVERVRARVGVVDGHPVVVTDNVRREEIDIESS